MSNEQMILNKENLDEVAGGMVRLPKLKVKTVTCPECGAVTKAIEGTHIKHCIGCNIRIDFRTGQTIPNDDVPIWLNPIATLHKSLF